MSDDAALLAAQLVDRPASLALVKSVIDVWPEHASYLRKGFQAQSPAIAQATEQASAAILKLIAGRERVFAEDYRWTCDQLREEELFFHREGRYRYATFEEAWREVYSNSDYMQRYVNGLLLTQSLWFNHAATFEMFLTRVLGAQDKPFDYLEVGPGHGLFVSFAAASPLARHIEGWDVSEVSLRETREALRLLGVNREVSLTQVDILKAEPPRRRFDLIVISEVLEHLERPDVALAFLRSALAEDGRIYISLPLNSPSPDHIYLFSTPDDVRTLVEGAGLRVESVEFFATQGRKLDRALANRISVSAGVIARRA
jgi:2-polyprenyl-3-methyl-5-hydroxy-6-metoxy-1,4-benzoquinol methylase